MWKYIYSKLKIWGNTYTANLIRLVLLEKKVVRLICAAQRLDHPSSLFYDLRILKLPDMVKLKTAKIINKAFNCSLLKIRLPATWTWCSDLNLV